MVYPVVSPVGIHLAQLALGWWPLADTLVGSDGPRVLWRSRTAVAVPTPKQGEGDEGSRMRHRATEIDGTIVARVTPSAGEELTPIHGAWRLDRSRWRISTYPADSLTCYNEEGG